MEYAIGILQERMEYVQHVLNLFDWAEGNKEKFVLHILELDKAIKILREYKE